MDIESILTNYQVGVVKDESLNYPKEFSINPDGSLPSYKHIEEQIRSVIALSLNTPYDDPLINTVFPGDSVLIKPNLVFHYKEGGPPIECLVTHWSVIYEVAKLVLIKLGKNGRLIIGDAPIQGCDFKLLTEKQTPLKEIVKHLNSFFHVSVELVDFRGLTAEYKSALLVNKSSKTEHAKEIKLNNDSLLHNTKQDIKRYRTIDYPFKLTRKYHNIEYHVFKLNNYVIESDVIINMPKLKTHCKTGITASLKNLVGTLADKQSLPHHRQGSSYGGGDEYCNAELLPYIESKLWDIINLTKKYSLKSFIYLFLRIIRKIFKIFGKVSDPLNIYGGSWYGNDTLWRGVLDINGLCLYCGKYGILSESIKRKYLTIIDGIVAGEGEGPLFNIPKNAGLLLSAENPVALDAVSANIIGFDYNKIPLIFNALKIKKYPIMKFDFNDIIIHSNNEILNNKKLNDVDYLFKFKPSKNWVNHIEKE